ncbi:MAG: hypothetical protein KF768_07595 [Phycisphaeraceae bacterium]|nr:hypothetical protein [Phycisphaeraceae bacterium]
MQMIQNMLDRSWMILRKLTPAMALAVAVLFASMPAFADRLTLKDGTVLEGEVTREGDGFFFFKVKIGQVENERLVMINDVASLERSKPADAATAAETKAKPSSPARAREKKPGDPTRVAILDFGLPLNEPNRPDDMVGIMVNAASWEHVIPMLEEDGTDVVVVRIASGGGMVLELSKFNDLFEKEYKPRFRTVAWPEYAISAACMSPWVLEEVYFFRRGRYGGNTMFSGPGVAAKGFGLEQMLAYMERVSALGKKDPKIMRAMQIQEPLSCTIDPVTGQVEWFQDESGEILVNPKGRVLTFTSEMAMKTKFAKGLADDVDELMQVMGIPEYEIVGQRARAYIAQNIRDNDKTEKEMGVVWTKYQNHVAAARQFQDQERRGAEVGLARRYLSQIRRMLGVNPNFELMYGTTTEWFQIQEEMLRELMRRR